MRAVRALRLAVFLIASALALAPVGAAAKPPVWVVRSHGATLVLFGSIHLLPAGLDWRPAALDDALATADELWFELPIDAATDNQAAAVSLARGGLPSGLRLGALMTADETRKLRQAALSLDCLPAAVERMQPWMAELTLSIAEDVRSGASAASGVEDQLQATTPPAVERRAFETAKQQIEMLAGAPIGDQLASLNWTVDEIERDPASYQRVVGEWMAGDVSGLQRDAVAPLWRVSPRLYDRLVRARNRRWARTLAARLQKPGRIVVVVGVAHLVGRDGVPALLRARGFQVEGP